MLYYSLVYTRITYCVTAWGGVSNSALQPMIRMHKKIIRCLTFSTLRTPSKPLFFTLKLLPFNLIYKLNISILMYKIQNNLITGSYNITPINQTHNYPTRLAQNNNFYQTYNRTTIGQTTSSAQGLKIWREIPSNIKSLPIHLFKIKLKQELLNRLEEEMHN